MGTAGVCVVFSTLVEYREFPDATDSFSSIFWRVRAYIERGLRTFSGVSPGGFE